MNANEKTGAEVVAVVTSLLKAYEMRDLKKVMDAYASDPDVTAIGTNLDEFLTGREKIRQAYEEDFDAFSRFGLTLKSHHVSAEGHVAWMSAECLAFFEIDGDEITTLSRLTAVLLQRAGEWKIIQFHLSFPADESGVANPENRL